MPKVYCKFCKHHKHGIDAEDYYCENDYFICKYPETYFEPAHEKRCKKVYTRCSIKNEHCDCKDYEPIQPSNND